MTKLLLCGMENAVVKISHGRLRRCFPEGTDLPQNWVVLCGVVGCFTLKWKAQLIQFADANMYVGVSGSGTSIDSLHEFIGRHNVGGICVDSNSDGAKIISALAVFMPDLYPEDMATTA